VLADGPEGLLLLHATATRLRTAATAKTRRYGFFTRLPLFPGSGNPVRCCWLPALLSILSVTRSSIASRVQCVPQPVAQQVERERQEQQEHPWEHHHPPRVREQLGSGGVRELPS